MYSCKKVSELNSQAEVRKLTLTERLGLKFHMLICVGCKKIEKQMHFIRQASKTMGQNHLSTDCRHCLSDNAKQRIGNAISKQSEQDPAEK